MLFRSTIVVGVFLIAAVIWLPVWVQLVLFGLAVVWCRYRAIFLIPALVADMLYAPERTLSMHHLKMTIIVAVCIIIRVAIRRMTRIGYDKVS